MEETSVASSPARVEMLKLYGGALHRLRLKFWETEIGS
jgi:hypothetical protein